MYLYTRTTTLPNSFVMYSFLCDDDCEYHYLCVHVCVYICRTQCVRVYLWGGFG